MDRVHSKCAHFKHAGIFDRVEVGNGGWTWIIVSLALMNYQIWRNEESRKVFWLVYDEVQGHIHLSSVLSFVLVNIARWVLVYIISDELSSILISSVICACISLEAVVAAFGAGGFVGIIFRYLSLCQLMKSISYLLARRESSILGKDDQVIDKPKEKASLAWYILLPTLCYQEEYPVRKSISIYSLIMYSLMVCPLSLFTYFCFKMRCMPAVYQFWAKPSVDSYISIFMWCNIGWVSTFVLVFIVFFGGVSEVTRFGDRTFFEAWWNASVSSYWRKWNAQVYRWIRRHVYRNLIKRNITIRSSKIIIFIVSGLIHEYIIGDAVSCRGIGFFTMASQLPLDAFMQLGHKSIGMNQQIAVNIAFNVIGAPGLALMSGIPAHFLRKK